MAGVVDAVEVFFAETVGLEVEDRVVEIAVAEGIDIGDEVADVAIGEDQPGDLALIGGLLRRRHRGPGAEVETGEEGRHSSGRDDGSFFHCWYSSSTYSGLERSDRLSGPILDDGCAT